MLRYLYNDNSHLFPHFSILFFNKNQKAQKFFARTFEAQKEHFVILSVRFESQVLSPLIPLNFLSTIFLLGIALF